MDSKTEKLVRSIRENVKVSYLNRRGQELAVRCPDCGDSIKNPTHAHCNIRLTDPNAILFHCVRCDYSGMVDPNFLRRLGVLNESALILAYRNTISVKKKVRQALKSFKSGKRNKLPILKIPVASSKFELEKLDYISDRLGFEITPETAKQFRIIPSLRKLFKYNPWMKPTEDIRLMKKIANDAVGFLSADRTHIIFRDTTDTWERRYFNYRVFPFEMPEASKMYFVNSSIDILLPVMNLVITEGIFDAISVAENFEKDGIDKQNTLVVSANGKGFSWVIKTVRKMGFLSLNVKIYSDSDVSYSFYKELLQSDPLLNSSAFSVFYNDFKDNSKKKDFGVPLEKIHLKKISLYK